MKTLSPIYDSEGRLVFTMQEIDQTSVFFMVRYLPLTDFGRDKESKQLRRYYETVRDLALAGF